MRNRGMIALTGKELLLVLVALISTATFSQKAKKIDQLFEEWNQPKHPGGVVMVSKGDEAVYSMAFGLANLQYDAPMTTTSVFNIGSVSKQFTALGIALLQKEGKLSFEDDIRKYLPELPGFEFKITIHHLLNHSSGLRGTPELFALAGWRDGDAITTNDDFNYLCKQKDLNFVPGSEFMYSNSNYILLAMIIGRVTNQDFSEWMKANVFVPLGMTDTYVDEMNLGLSSQVCTPYIEHEENRFIPTRNSSLDIGAANVYSTAADLNTWVKRLSNPDEHWEDVINLLISRDTLSTGELNNYNFGLIIDQFKGNKRIYHTGGVPGYLSFAMCFPDEELTVIVLTNYIDYRVQQRIDMLLTLFLKNKEKKKKQKPKQVELDKKTAQSYCSNYWNINNSYSRKVYLENDTLWYLRTNGFKSPLFQVTDSTFIIGGIDDLVIVKFETHRDTVYMYVKDGNKLFDAFKPYETIALSMEELMVYEGVFYSPELEAYYTFSIEDGSLVGYQSRHGFFEVELLGKDFVSWSGFATAQYQRNGQGSIVGFYVTLNRVRNVWFEKK